MKKRAWLLLLPLMLCGAVFWARDAAWSRMEEEFRLALGREYAAPNALGIEVFIGNSKLRGSLGHLSKAEVKALAAQLHLMRAARLVLSPEPIQIQFEGEATDFSIALDGDQSVVSANNFLGNWGKQELDLTPESAHTLRKHVKTRWNSQIAKIRQEIRLGQT